MNLRVRFQLLSFLLLLALPFRASAGVGVWTPLPLDGASVWAVAVDPESPDTVYAGTRNGIFKSIDGGETWAAASRGLGPQGVFVRALAASPDAVYAGTDRNGAFKSTDGGATWLPISAGLPGPSFTTPNVGALIVDPRAPNRIWAGTSRGVYLSTNGGATWQERLRGLALDVPTQGMALAPDGKTLYVSNLRGVFKTTNQGKKWIKASTGLKGGSYFDVVIDPHAPSTVFLGSNGGLWKTTDGGGKWKRVASSLLSGAVAAVVFQGERLFVGHVSLANPGIYSSDNRGTTWTAARESPSDFVVELAAGPDLLYAGTPSDSEAGGVFLSPDRGVTWERAVTGLTSLAVQGVAVDPSDPDVLYAGVDVQGVYKSSNHGTTWERLDLGPAPVPSIRISALLVDPSDPSTVYAGSGFGPGGLFRSEDAGASWESVLFPLMTEALAADPRTAGAVWAAGYQRLHHTDDGGDTWERVPFLAGEEDLWLRDFQVDKADPRILWAAGGVFEHTPPPLIKLKLRLYHSTDGGQTWERRDTGIGGSWIISLALDPADPSRLLAGTDTGLYRSTDAGLTWTLVPGFTAEVNEVVAAPTSPTTFYANLTGFGIQRSTDGGITWTPARRGLAPVPALSLTVDPTDPHRLYAGSATRGVFTYTEPN